MQIRKVSVNILQQMIKGGVILRRTFEREYVLCVLLMLLISISFGHSTLIYTISMISMVVVCYYRFFKMVKYIPKSIVVICAYLTVVPVGIAFAIGQFQDVLMANVSILLPYVIATYPVIEGREYRMCKRLGYFAIVLNLLKGVIPVLRDMNENSYSFLTFISFSSIFILVRINKTPISLAMLLYCGYALTNAGSRNALVIYLVVAVLVCIPYKMLAQKAVYRGIYIASLGFQCVSNLWMIYIGGHVFWSNLFYDIVSPYIDKAWGIENRINTYAAVSNLIWNQSWSTLLFGNGKAFLHAHNGFYQTTFLYGLIGFGMIIFLYVMIFEMGLKLIRRENNEFIAGCVVSMCGLFLLQGTDVFLLGCKSCVVVPFLLSGTILRKYLFPEICIPRRVYVDR